MSMTWIVELMYQFISFTAWAWDFMNYSITIGQSTLSIWLFLGGAGLTTIIIWSIIKAVL
jgi:hypothetical protein